MKLWACAFAFFIVFNNAWASALTAKLDRQSISLDETVTLVLSGTILNRQTVDTSPLERDFILRGQRQESQLRLINGQRSAVYRWQVTMLPKRSGIINIPPLKVGHEMTPGLRLNVTPSQQQTDTGHNPIATTDHSQDQACLCWSTNSLHY